jgi:hypothetical protein
MAAITPPPRRRPPFDSFHNRSLIDLASFHDTVYPDIYPSFLAFRDGFRDSDASFETGFRRVNWLISGFEPISRRFFSPEREPEHTNEEDSTHVCSGDSFVCKGLFPRVNWDST